MHPLPGRPGRYKERHKERHDISLRRREGRSPARGGDPEGRPVEVKRHTGMGECYLEGRARLLQSAFQPS